MCSTMHTFFNPVNKREYNFLKVGVYWMCQYIEKMKLFKPKFLTFGSLLMTSVLWTDRKHTKDQHTLLLEIWKHWILSLYLVTCSSFTWFFYLMNQRGVFFQKYERLLLLIHADLLSGIRYCVLLLYLRFMLMLTSCHSPPYCSVGTIYSW